MNKQYNNYFKAISSGYLKTIISSLIGLFMVPFTLKFISQSEYGVFAIAGEIMLWLGLVQLGTGTALTSRASHLVVKKDNKILSELASTAFGLQLIAGLIIVVFGAIISKYVNVLFKIDETVQNINIVIFVMIISASITITTQVLMVY
jgi:O-antigen/teichoic acid export membrane protein